MTISRLIQRCVEAAGLLQDLNTGEDSGVGASSVPKLAAAVITHILQGHCFRRLNLPYPTFFTDYIFQSLNRTSNLQIMGNCLPLVALLRNNRGQCSIFLRLDLEELLHQLGVGGEGAAHVHDRKRRSVTDGHTQDGCKRDAAGTPQDWAEVPPGSRCVVREIEVPKSQSLSASLSI